MKFAPLVLANLLRRKVRTLLTAGSFAVALFLFCVLATIRAGFNQGVEAAGADRVVVTNRVSLIQPLPLAYRDRILKIPGVERVTWANWFGGVYQDEKNFFPQFAVDPASYHEIYQEFLVPEDQWQAFLADRTGAVAGAATAERFGWKLGDRIPIQGAIFPGDWQFTLRGIYTGRRPSDDLTQFWFHWKYLEENGPEWTRGFVGWYVLRVAPGHDLVEVSRAIDERFANSPWETRAQAEQAFMASFVKQMGNIEALLLSIGGVVFFTLLLVTGNTLAMSVRERTAELAVLKTVGFPGRAVLLLVLAEALAIAVAGGACGIGLAKAFTLGGDPSGGLLPSFYLSPGAMGAAAGLAVGTGLLAGLAPALGAMRLSIVDALRRL